MAKIKTSEKNSKREIIIVQAAKLFKEKGYKAASMRELATALGVEAASLYNHIESKNDLLNAICMNVANRYTSNINSIEGEQSTVIK
ncbi:MAG TPA: TetR/AcrR family transcriptional regulator, partial [Segetibacter sp.]|nr:TetR/AcrR family transcriptional regulator [Segetibacter sp.]